MANDLTSWILSSEHRNVDEPIVTDADRPSRTISWRQYSSMVKRIAVGLRDLGLADQEAVGMLADSDPYYHVLGDGVIAAGGIFVPFPVMNGQADLANCITVGRCKWLAVSTQYLDLALASLKELDLDDSHLLIFDPPGLEKYSGSRMSFGGLLNAQEAAYQPITCSRGPEKAIAHRSFTSGTTGPPKAAEVSHACWIRRLRQMLWAPSLKEAEKLLVQVPIFHVSGLASFIRTTAGRNKLWVTTVTDPGDYLDRVQQFGIQMLILSPRLMDRIVSALHAGERSRETLASVQVACSIGSRSRLDTMDAFSQLLPEKAFLLDGYGSTECGGVTSTRGYPASKPPFVGFPTGETQFKIVDFETTEEVEKGLEGEIVVRSPYIFNGYCDNAVATESSFIEDSDGKGSWFRTGDKGFVSPENGQLAVSGRFKEVFKVRYEEVSPVEVESEIMRYGGVEDAAVTSTKARDNDLDNEAVAYVVRKAGATMTAQQIVDHIASRMARHKAPEGGVIFVDEIPRNVAQKIIRNKLATLPELDGTIRYLSASV